MSGCFNTVHCQCINCRLNKLEQYKNCQIDENRKVSKRIDELEKKLEMSPVPLVWLDNAYIKCIEDLKKEVKRLGENEKRCGEGCDKLNERVEKVENYTYDSGDISSMQGQLDNLHKNFDYLVHQIDRVESNQLTKELDPQVWAFVNKRLDKLQQLILDTRVEFITQIGNDIKPHKCPVCDGRGDYRRANFTNNEYIDCMCISCKGKGIIWG